MNIPLPIRAKLVGAALALVLVYALSTWQDFIGVRSSGEAAFRIGCAIFGLFMVFMGVFGSAQLQLLWGWGLTVAAPFLAGLCVFVLRGPDLIFGLLAMIPTMVGAYLLLMDSGVRDYRKNLRR